MQMKNKLFILLVIHICCLIIPGYYHPEKQLHIISINKNISQDGQQIEMTFIFNKNIEGSRVTYDIVKRLDKKDDIKLIGFETYIDNHCLIIKGSIDKLEAWTVERRKINQKNNSQLSVKFNNIPKGKYKIKYLHIKDYQNNIYFFDKPQILCHLDFLVNFQQHFTYQQNKKRA